MEWTSISDLLPQPYKTVLISEDGGQTTKRAYRIFSEKTGDLWMNADDEFDFYYLSEYPEWKYES